MVDELMHENDNLQREVATLNERIGELEDTNNHLQQTLEETH